MNSRTRFRVCAGLGLAKGAKSVHRIIRLGIEARREGHSLGKRSVAVGLGLVVAAIGAAAQGAAPAPDRAAMERALQQADGPKRRILEAARLKAGAPAPVAAAAAPAPAPAPAVAPAPPRAEAAAAAVPAPDTEIVVVITMPPGIEPVVVPAPARVGSVAAVAPLEAEPPPPRLLDLPPAPAAPLPPPRLLSTAEPDLPARMFRRAGGRVEALVDIVIDADGSVKSASVVSSNHADADEAVLEAVRRWRYEPQAAARPHQVRLLVSPP